MLNAWKFSMEEKAALLQEAALWKASAEEWHEEAMKQARENITLRKLLKQRLQLIVEAMPETMPEN